VPGGHWESCNCNRKPENQAEHFWKGAIDWCKLSPKYDFLSGGGEKRVRGGEAGKAGYKPKGQKMTTTHGKKDPSSKL